jgi:hypothetical protein
MSSGLFPDMELVERFTATVSAATIAQTFVSPVDLDVIGMALTLGTAGGPLTVNISNFPTSQQGGGGSTVAAYNLWTTPNVPTLAAAAKSNLAVTQSVAVAKNVPYALNYPLPGLPVQSGFSSSQATTQTSQNAVVTPPTMFEYGIVTGTAPDNTYLDYNGISQPATWVHAGDVLSFVVAGTVGAAANLNICMYFQKH